MKASVSMAALVELIKAHSSSNQLWSYARDFPAARLFVAVPPPISPNAKAFLSRLGMDLWN